MRKIMIVLLTTIFLFGCEKKPSITSASEAAATQDLPFEYVITASNQPTTFSADVPSGLGLVYDDKSHKITGSPVKTGVFDFKITAGNSAGTDTRVVKLIISPQPHPVVSEKELFIIDHKVLQSEALSGNNGVALFRSVLQRISGAKTPDQLDSFAKAWFSEWELNTSLNTDQFSARKLTADTLRKAWENDSFRLIAVVNRLDLTRFEDADVRKKIVKMGEGRLVFEVLSDKNGTPLPFTIIFEFGLPHTSSPDMDKASEAWAVRWHALGRDTLSDDRYVNELSVIVDDYTNTSGTLNQVRTNEIVGGPWELREFKLLNGALKQSVVAQTPRDNARGVDFDSYVESDKVRILDGKHQVDPRLLGGVSNSQLPPGVTAVKISVLHLLSHSILALVATGLIFRI